MNKTYYVKYRMSAWDIEQGVVVLAKSKEEAYEKACFEIIPTLHTYSPYSVWVESVTYNNGNCRRFNTCDGVPY